MHILIEISRSNTLLAHIKYMQVFCTTYTHKKLTKCSNTHLHVIMLRSDLKRESSQTEGKEWQKKYNSGESPDNL